MHIKAPLKKVKEHISGCKQLLFSTKSKKQLDLQLSRSYGSKAHLSALDNIQTLKERRAYLLLTKSLNSNSVSV